MKKKLLVPLCLTLIVLCAGCAGSSVVATVGSEKITLQDFEDSYAKNNGGWEQSASSTIEDRQRFLDLLVKFRLKVLEARGQGLLQDTSVQNELDSYRLSVAQTYMVEKELTEPRVEGLYSRKQEELRASHILIRIPANASPAETLAAYNKALQVIGLIPRTGFESLAALYSEDPSAQRNHGDLGYFTVGRMVPEFEDACYALKGGEYTHLPIRTRFGYHVIKVVSHRPNAGMVRLAHLLRQFSPDLKDTAAVRDTVWAVYRKIKQGMSFEEAVKQYTQDEGSRMMGGEIGTFERSRLPLDMSDIVFSTPKDSVTMPVRANYGFHIFKVMDYQRIPAFSLMERELRQLYQQNWYDRDYKQYVDGLKERYALLFDDSVVTRLAHSFDSTKTPSSPRWSDTLSSVFLNRMAFSVAGKTLTVRDFLEKVESSPEHNALPLTPANVQRMVEKVAEALVLEEHARTAPDRHPTLARLLREYEDGVLLYRIEQDEIWKKLVVNDSLLKRFYGANKEKYRWPERVNVGEIYVTSDSLAKAAYSLLEDGEDFLSVAEEHTMRTGYREKLGVWGFQPLTLNDLTQKAATMKIDSVSEPFKFQNGWSIIKVIGRDSARTKTFEEARPELISGFQEQASKQREQEWIEQLRKKYGVTVDPRALAEAFKRKRSENQ